DRAPRDRVDSRARVGTHRADAARRQGRVSLFRFCLQLRDDLVDLTAGLAHLNVELLVETTAERLFTVSKRFLALPHPAFGFAQRLALARREAMLVLDRAHIAVDLREVFRELRLARAQVLPRGGDDGRVQAEARGDLERKA